LNGPASVSLVSVTTERTTTLPAGSPVGVKMKVWKAKAKRLGPIRFHAPWPVPGASLSVSITPPPRVKVSTAFRGGPWSGVTSALQVPTMAAA
jgi:hypothetical protein